MIGGFLFRIWNFEFVFFFITSVQFWVLGFFSGSDEKELTWTCRRRPPSSLLLGRWLSSNQVFKLSTGFCIFVFFVFLYLYLYLYLYLLQSSVHTLYMFLLFCISSHAVVTSVRLSNVVTLFLFRCSGVCEEGETSAADILASLARALEGYVPMLAMLRWESVMYTYNKYSYTNTQ